MNYNAIWNDRYGANSDSITDFTSTLEKIGYIVQEGRLQYLDVLKLGSLGVIEDCFGNHAGAPYASYMLSPAPNQEPAKGQRPPKGFDPASSNNYPPNINYLGPRTYFKLRPDEAIVMIRKTPPPTYYFGFRSYIGFYITVGNEETGKYHRLFNSLGDQLNNVNIWTANTPEGTDGNPFSSSRIIITTADMGINSQIREALRAGGFSSSITNNDNISLGMANMGLEKGKDHFNFVMRAILFEDATVGKEIFNEPFRLCKSIPYYPEKPCHSTSTMADSNP